MAFKKKKKKTNRIWLTIITLLVISALLVWFQVFSTLASSDQLRVFFFDIGQGDAIMIDFGQNEQALIDGGPSKEILSYLGETMPFNDRTIEYLILTHPDRDHLAGFLAILDRYQVNTIFYTNVEHSSQLYQKFKEQIKEKNIKTKIVRAGDIIRSEARPEVKIEIIYPKRSMRATDNLNNTSIVSILDSGKIEFLLTGDVEEEVWQELTDQLPEAEILKVSHHGARNGTTEELLNQVKAEIGVISVGRDNSYGHPTRDVLDLLGQYQIKIFRTDQQGTITISTDGEEYSIKTEQ